MFPLQALPERPSRLPAPPCPDESSSKSCETHVASYVYMAEVRASIPVHVCRILSTLTATGFANAGFRASCCALALLDRASTYVLLNSVRPPVVFLCCHGCCCDSAENISASMLTLKKKYHGTTRAHMLTKI
uniref:Uncharacterized protein n=1 Tax=Rhipicephalus appendiculatus TaxID=34631 RepID=A0A131Z1P4_RHIAP